MGSRRVVIEFLGQDKSASKTADDVEKKTSKLGSTLAGVGKTAAVGLAGGIVIGTVALAKMTKGAAEDQAAQDRLAKTLRNTTGANAAQVASIEDYISKTGVATGITDDQMRPAFENLVRATKDTGKAQGLMNLAMDVSAGTGKSLESVTMALAKAQNGSTGALGKLGIATKDASGKALSFDQIQKNLAGTFKGQAATAANTFEGKMSRLKLIFGETQETIGAKLLPIATRLGDWLLNVGVPAIGKLGAWLKQNLMPPLQRFGDYLAKTVAPMLQNLAAKWLAGARSAFDSVRKSVQDNEPQLRKLVSAIGSAVKWIAEKLGPVLGWLAGTQMKNVGKQISLVITAISKMVSAVQWIARVVGDAAGWIGKKWTEIKNGAGSLLTYFRNLPGNIARAMGDTTRTLVSKGSGFLTGLWSGLMSKWREVTKWIGGLKASVSAWLGDTSKFLVQKGRNVLWGFLDGLKGVWTEVTKWIGGIATWIKDHKGPISLDARLLTPAGKAIMAGFLKGLKSGAGPAWNFVKSVGGKSVDMLSSVFGSGGQQLGGRRIRYQGQQLDLSTFQKIRQAENQIGSMLRVTQGSYEGASSYSGSTHTGGGVFDVVGGNLERINSTLRSLGFASWVREPWQGPWPRHIHAVEIGNQRAHPSAQRQAQDYLRGGDGLAGYKQGTPWVPNDQLAFLHKGEAVLPAEVNRRRITGGGDVIINLTVNGALDPTAVAKQVQTMLIRLKKLNGGLELGLT
ncbi:hypothetical protein EV643_102463 [Kribbella sp. VKM Ac-2527]|uniref:Uncharacterized protein n=1 Tax=Kribbella caucasensis TaxID=2512215 RepID=A0A4R6KM36_9ACTN|nr:hypothetical protein [Kribbella sp. VKM Ac-2527]TDO52624.1 hypothetical protein EV643_102463 [Kribbella sp. VKM Ac-2527]